MEERGSLEARLQAMEEMLSKIQRDMRRSRQWAMFRVLFFNILPIVIVVLLSIPLVQALRPMIETLGQFIPTASPSNPSTRTPSNSLSAQECRTLCDRFVP